MLGDPLSLLREFVSNGKIDEVVQSGDRVDFGGKFSFSKGVPTGYKSQQVCVGTQLTHRSAGWPALHTRPHCRRHRCRPFSYRRARPISTTWRRCSSLPGT
jgi:hypothetical protein